MKMIVSYLDRDGIPRAWATGDKEDEDLIKDLALEMLDEYILSKPYSLIHEYSRHRC